MSFGYDEVSQLQTRIAILESQVDVKDVSIGLLNKEIKRLTDVVSSVSSLVSKEKWDGSDIGTQLEYKLEPRK
jgi:prefoldin subunit 5